MTPRNLKRTTDDDLADMLGEANAAYMAEMRRLDPDGRTNVCHLLNNKKLTDLREAANVIYHEIKRREGRAGRWDGYDEGEEGGPISTFHLEVGEEVDLAPNAYVKRKGRNDYVLVDRKNRARSRWGTLKEIVKDANYYVTYHELPPAEGGRW